MLLLLLMYSLNQSGFGDAAPISSIQQRDPGSCGDSNSDRTMWNIIWSCLSTIFLCTWVSIHPNIAFTPERRGTTWHEEWLWEPLRKFWKYKLPLFLWALIFPEWILAWAVRQWIMAGSIAKDVPGGTRTHGFFVIMGGFHLFQRSSLVTKAGDNSREDEVPIRPLDYIPEGTTVPTENEIKDRGKSDVLAKVIVLVQTSWFVTQCIARGIKHLHITEIEIVTLAYTMINFVIYVFWWHKPRDVGCPIRVYIESQKRLQYAKPPTWMPKLLGNIFDNLAGEEYIAQLYEAQAVPMFWSGMSRKNNNDARLVSMASNLGPTILGMGFGATHFIAWPYEFPSHPELMLWRISCITMVAVPVVCTFACFAGMVSPRHGSAGRVLKFFIEFAVGITWYPALLGGWLYLFARIATIIVAFTTLRSLPTDAFKVVDWTTFIPHI